MILTAFFFGLFLYWSLKIQSRFLYKKVKKNENPTHVFVEGSRKTFEIVKIYSID
jgi:hypothetical protein